MAHTSSFSYQGLMLSIFISLIVLDTCSSTVVLQVLPEIYQESENEDVIFVCRNTDHTTPSSIIWRLPNRTELGPAPGPDGARITAQHHLLHIRSTRFNDTGYYRCFDGDNHSRSAAGFLEITVPPRILERIPVQEIHIGRTVLIQCTVFLGYPEAEVIWYKNTRFVNETNDPRITQRENGLEINNVQMSDEGEYECYVHNEFGSDSLEIQVAFRAPPQFVNSNANLDVIIRSGDPLNLDCSAAGAPLPSYNWIVPSTSRAAHTTNTDSSLGIPFIGITDSGNYTCVVENESGRINRTYSVSVIMPPFPIRASFNRTVAVGHPATFNCSVNAYPAPTYNWFTSIGNTERPLVGNRFRVINGTLHVSSFEESDFDPENCRVIFVCYAENPYGQSTQFYTLTMAGSCLSTIPTTSTSSPTANTDTSTPDTSTPDTPPTLDEPGSSEEPEESREEENEKGKVEIILISVFTVILVVLATVIVGVCVYLLLPLCRRSAQKLDIEKQQARVHNDHSTAVRNGTATVVPDPRLIIDDGSGYCKLNHFPQGRHSSTSSTNSTSPLISQNSIGVENDSVFGTEGAIPGERQAEMTAAHHNSPALHPHRHNVGAAQRRPPNFHCQPADYLEIVTTREPHYETIS